MRLILLTPARSLAKENPIGCSITRTLKALWVYEGLQKIDGVIVVVVPIERQLPGHMPKDV